jgi:hypothetical protein
VSLITGPEFHISSQLARKLKTINTSRKSDLIESFKDAVVPRDHSTISTILVLSETWASS